MLAGRHRLEVEPLVLLHVGQVYQQIEWRPGEEQVDVRVLIGDGVRFGLSLGSLRDDVARADELDVGAVSQVRQITVGDAAAANDADANAARRLCLRLAGLGGERHPGQHGPGHTTHEGPTVDVVLVHADPLCVPRPNVSRFPSVGLTPPYSQILPRPARSAAAPPPPRAPPPPPAGTRAARYACRASPPRDRCRD